MTPPAGETHISWQVSAEWKPDGCISVWRRGERGAADRYGNRAGPSSGEKPGWLKELRRNSGTLKNFGLDPMSSGKPFRLGNNAVLWPALDNIFALFSHLKKKSGFFNSIPAKIIFFSEGENKGMIEYAFTSRIKCANRCKLPSIL